VLKNLHSKSSFDKLIIPNEKQWIPHYRKKSVALSGSPLSKLGVDKDRSSGNWLAHIPVTLYDQS
jgi:hypothetical protein